MRRALVLLVLAAVFFSQAVLAHARTSDMAGMVFGWEWPPELPEPPLVRRDRRPVAMLAEIHGSGLPLRDPWVRVTKSEFRLDLFDGDNLIKSYPISLGFAPIGQKMQEGDGKTPEGVFYISQRATNRQYNNKFLGTRWMRLSYPDLSAAQRGLKTRLISQKEYDRIVNALEKKLTPLQTTKLGGGIGIHGGSFDWQGRMVRTWTLGCVGMYDADVEELYQYTPVGTKVVIIP